MAFLQDLKKGKVFGYRIFYLYSGKAMLLWDFLALIISSTILTLLESWRETVVNTIAKGVLAVGSVVLALLVVFFISKLFLRDLGHWFPWYKGFVKILKKDLGVCPSNS